MQMSERLFSYDQDAIGQEFKPQVGSALDERRRIESRRQELVVKGWQDSMSQSSRLPKSAVRNLCSFERLRSRSESLLSWSLTVLASGLVGILLALLIRHLYLK